MEHGEVLFPQWQEVSRGEKPRVEKWASQFGVSTSGTNYAQSDSFGSGTSFFQLGLNVEGSVHYAWKDFWHFAGGVNLTGLPISLDSSGGGIRFLNFNLQTIYPFRWGRTQWSVDWVGIYSYQTNLSSNSGFSFSDVQGVTIYPRIQKNFQRGKKAWFSVKYMPILDFGRSSLFLGPGNSEVTFQAGVRAFILNHHWLDLVGQVNFLALGFSGASRVSTVQANSYTLGVNYIF